MAKRKAGGVNKAEEIRKYFAEHPGAKGIEVVAGLAKKGIKVAPAQVSNVKMAGKKKGKRKLRLFNGGGSNISSGMRGGKSESAEARAVKIVESAVALLDAAGSFEAAVNVLDKIRPVSLPSRKPR